MEAFTHMLSTKVMLSLDCFLATDIYVSQWHMQQSQQLELIHFSLVFHQGYLIENA